MEIETYAGSGFPCHQTTNPWVNQQWEREESNEIHCAGSLILQWECWEGFYGSVAQEARSGSFDPYRLPTTEEAGVFSSWASMSSFMRNLGRSAEEFEFEFIKIPDGPAEK